MNLHFVGNNQYVQLTASKIRTKLNQYEQLWSAQVPGARQMVFAPLLILCPTPEYRMLMRSFVLHPSIHPWAPLSLTVMSFDKFITVTASEGTSSGPVSGGHSLSVSNTEAEYMMPEAVRVAVAYMAENGSKGIELYIFTAALKDPMTLAGFEAIDGYEGTRCHLIELWVSSTCSILLICSISQAPAPFT